MFSSQLFDILDASEKDVISGRVAPIKNTFDDLRAALTGNDRKNQLTENQPDAILKREIK